MLCVVISPIRAVRTAVLLGLLDLLFISPYCSAQIYIDDPPNLVGFIQGSTAAFGTPPYGEYLVGEIVYGSPNNTDQPHCNSDYSVDEVDPPSLKFFLVRRGGCHFAQKVRAAAELGADAVIVVDNNELRTKSDIRMIIMAEDPGESHHQKLETPSILITYDEGEKLIQAKLEGAEIRARLEWDLPNAEVVSMDQWNSPALLQSVKFLSGFAPYARALGPNLDFKPHFWIIPLVRDYNSMCTEPSGKFCSIEAEWGGNTTGKAVVEESVRQKCLWKETLNRSNGEHRKAYWDYVEKFPSSCPATKPRTGDGYFSEECSFELMKSIGAPYGAVRACFKDNFEEILNDEKFSSAWSPTATMINNWRYSGPMNPEAVTAAICTGYHKEPKECRTLLKAGTDDRSTKEVFPWWIIVLSLLCVAFATFMTIICYRAYIYKKLRNELRYEVFEEVKNRTQGRNKGTTGKPPSSASVMTSTGEVEHGEGPDVEVVAGRPFDGVTTLP